MGLIGYVGNWRRYDYKLRESHIRPLMAAVSEYKQAQKFQELNKQKRKILINVRQYSSCNILWNICKM